MRILIAEDDFTSRTMLSAVLRKSGYEVVVTENGLEALQAMQVPDPPRLVILDWMMPEMDGVEVVRRVRQLQLEPPPYVIILTSRMEKKDIVAGLDAGADDYLSKPFDTGELRARVAVGKRMIEVQEALIRSRELMAHQAAHDTLTGLFNRRAILEILARELARVGRDGGRVTVGLCDIDHFKQINDTHGHQVGDDVLCAIAELLETELREYDSVGRLGGEEFLIVIPGPEKCDPGAPLARICEKVAQSPLRTRSGTARVTVSIGVACAGEGESVDQILGRADSALYGAKAQGRNRVVLAGERQGPVEPERQPSVEEDNSS